MVDASADCEQTKLTVGFAWLRRIASVTCRKSQVWIRNDGQTETIVIISDPQLAADWRSQSALVTTLTNIVAALGSNGWCHKVFCLDTGKCFYLNERWFSASERGLHTSYTRIA